MKLPLPKRFIIARDMRMLGHTISANDVERELNSALNKIRTHDPLLASCTNDELMRMLQEIAGPKS